MGSYKIFIPENTAPVGVKRIGIYNQNGIRVGSIPLGCLLTGKGRKLYSFGVLSDIHIGENTADSDFQKALLYFNDHTNFVCISGDLVHTGTESQIATYQSIVNTCSTIPVYACSGNHDGGHVRNIEHTISSYTGQPLYYSIACGEDLFIFLGNVSNAAGSLFTQAELQWLYETLEKNRNRRCFLFQHVRPDDGCGNALGIYTYDIWGGTEQLVFESLLRHYPNVIFFHGHSHLKFYLQKYHDAANLERQFGCWSVHVPSLSVPRDATSAVNPSIVSVYADSEGYLVDVYENGIHLRGRSFAQEEFLPVASYWLDTSIKSVDAGSYHDDTNTIHII